MHRWLAFALVLCAMLVGSCGRRADVPSVVLADDGKAEAMAVQDSGLIVTSTGWDNWERLEDKDYGVVCYAYHFNSPAMTCFLIKDSLLSYPSITDTRLGE